MRENWKGVALIISLLFIFSGCVKHSAIKQITDDLKKCGEQLSTMTNAQFIKGMGDKSKEIPKQVKDDGKSVKTKTLIDDLSTMSKKILASDTISSKSERAILTESLVGGAATGMAIGALAGQLKGGSTESTLAGASIGGLVGTFAGSVIGMNRIREIKNLRLKVDPMSRPIFRFFKLHFRSHLGTIECHFFC